MDYSQYSFGGGVESVIDDGDWSDARACSPALKEYPFQNKGDRTTYIIRQQFQQNAANFQAMARNTPHPVYPQALLVEESAHRNLGGGKIEWERLWATLPQTRKEPDAFLYEFQAGRGAELLGFVFPVASTVTYHYFLSADQASYPLSLAPRVLKLGSGFRKIGVGNLYVFAACICSSDPVILAENDTYGIWKGDILYRKRREIAGPTPSFWGNAFNLPISS